MKKAMVATWGNTDSEKEDDAQSCEETTNFCLMAISKSGEEIESLEASLGTIKSCLNSLSK